MPKLKVHTYELEPMKRALDSLSGMEWENLNVPYKVGKLRRIVGEHLEDFQRTRDDLISKHAKRDEEGNPIMAKDDKGNEMPNRVEIEDSEFQEVVSKLSEIGNETVEFDLPVGLNIEELQQEGNKVKGEIIEGIIPILDASREDS